MHGYRLTNVGDAVDDMDVLNKRTAVTYTEQVHESATLAAASAAAAATYATQAASHSPYLANNVQFSPTVMYINISIGEKIFQSQQKKIYAAYG